MIEKKQAFENLITYVNILNIGNHYSDGKIINVLDAKDEDAKIVSYNNQYLAEVKKILNVYPDIVNWRYKQENLTKTVLFDAIIRCDEKLVALLISYGANVNAKFEENLEFKTPLAIAANQSKHAHDTRSIIKIVQLLLQNGADATYDHSLQLAIENKVDKDISKFMVFTESYHIITSYILSTQSIKLFILRNPHLFTVCNKEIEISEDNVINKSKNEKNSLNIINTAKRLFNEAAPHSMPELALKINTLCYENCILFKAFTAIKIDIAGNKFSMPFEIIEKIFLMANRHDVYETPLMYYKNLDYIRNSIYVGRVLNELLKLPKAKYVLAPLMSLSITHSIGILTELPPSIYYLSNAIIGSAVYYIHSNSPETIPKAMIKCFKVTHNLITDLVNGVESIAHYMDA